MRGKVYGEGGVKVKVYEVSNRVWNAMIMILKYCRCQY